MTGDGEETEAMTVRGAEAEVPPRSICLTPEGSADVTGGYAGSAGEMTAMTVMVGDSRSTSGATWFPTERGEVEGDASDGERKGQAWRQAHERAE